MIYHRHPWSSLSCLIFLGLSISFGKNAWLVIFSIFCFKLLIFIAILYFYFKRIKILLEFIQKILANKQQLTYINYKNNYDKSIDAAPSTPSKRYSPPHAYPPTDSHSSHPHPTQNPLSFSLFYFGPFHLQA